MKGNRWTLPDEGSVFRLNEDIEKAVEAAPEYRVKRRLMVDALSLSKTIKEFPGDLTDLDVIFEIANRQEEIWELIPMSEVQYEV